MRGPGHIDIDRSLGKHYANPSSYISTDGREILFGEDLKRRYQEIWERDGRRCVECGRLLSFANMHPHHRTERSRGGDDKPGNLETRCYKHHIGSEGIHA